MGKIILIIFCLLVIAIFLKARQLWKRKRAFKLVETLSQEQTDKIIRLVLVKEGLIAEDREVSSTVLSDIWGQGVLVFSYELVVQTTDGDLSATRRQFVKDLQTVCSAQKLQGLPGYPPLMVTDFWVDERQSLHIDVANIANKATAQYVHDINKVEQ